MIDELLYQFSIQKGYFDGLKRVEALGPQVDSMVSKTNNKDMNGVAITFATYEKEIGLVQNVVLSLHDSVSICKKLIDSLRVAKEQSGEIEKGPAERYVAETSAEEAPQATNQLEDSVQLTTFSDDKAVIEEIIPLESATPTQYAAHTDVMEHTVVSFLQRPQLLAQTFWQPGGDTEVSKRGVVIFDKSIPEFLFTSMVVDKLVGFTSFRATAVIRLQVNSQPFQCGRLIMAAIPMPSLIQPRDQYMMKHPSLLQAVNHVQLDISKQTEVTLRVPFVSPFNCYDLIAGTYPWARLVVMIYSPLNVVEQVPLETLLWGSFDDVEMGTPTSSKPKIAYEQSGLVRSLANGAVSSLRSAERGAPALQTPKEVSNLSSLVGFSKPDSAEKGCSVYQRPTRDFATADGVDDSHVLSLSKDNGVEEIQGLGGTDADECSLEFVKKIPQYVDNFSYGVNNSYNSLLWSSAVTPTYYIPTSEAKLQGELYPNDYPSLVKASNVIQDVSQPTALHYLSSPFMYWSGSLVYTFRFVKTDYHSGRIEVSFHPFSGNNIDLTRNDFTYRVVVDLRDKTEVSVSIPYVSPTSWKRMSDVDPLQSGIGVVPWRSMQSYSTGMIAIRALTPLITSTTIVAKEIECLVEVRAGADYRLMGPVASQWYPMTLRGSTLSFSPPKEQAGEIFSLPGTQETRTSALQGFLPPSITSNDRDIAVADTQKFCAGEAFENFRALTRRFGFVEYYNPSSQYESYVSRVREMILPPLGKYQLRQRTDSDLYIYTVFNFQKTPTPTSFVGGMYAFFRGSGRYKIYSENNTRLISGRLDYGYNSEEFQVKKSQGPRFMAPSGYELGEFKEFGEFRVPFYSPTMVTPHLEIPDLISTMDGSDAYLVVSTTQYDGKLMPLRVAFAAGDDVNFSMFLGAPFCISLYALNSTYTDEEINPTKPNIYNFFSVSRLNVDPTLPPSSNDFKLDSIVDREGWLSMENLSLSSKQRVSSPSSNVSDTSLSDPRRVVRNNPNFVYPEISKGHSRERPRYS